jgi:hypothetical protein
MVPAPVTSVISMMNASTVRYTETRSRRHPTRNPLSQASHACSRVPAKSCMEVYGRQIIVLPENIPCTKYLLHIRD